MKNWKMTIIGLVIGISLISATPTTKEYAPKKEYQPICQYKFKYIDNEFYRCNIVTGQVERRTKCLGGWIWD